MTGGTQQISFLETAFQYSGHSDWLFINSGVTRKQRASKCDQLRNKLRCGPVSLSLSVFERNQVKCSKCSISPVRVTVVIDRCPVLRICSLLAHHPSSKELCDSLAGHQSGVKREAFLSLSVIYIFFYLE